MLKTLQNIVSGILAIPFALFLLLCAFVVHAEELRIGHYTCKENYVAAHEAAEEAQHGESFFQIAVNLNNRAYHAAHDPDKFAGTVLASDNLSTIVHHVEAGMTPEQAARKELISCTLKFNRTMELPHVVQLEK